MHEIAFVVAPAEYGVGLLDGVEPVIDGVSVADMFKHADGEMAWAGLVPPEAFLEEWQRIFRAGGAESVQILGCLCGNWDCSSVSVRVDVSEDGVVWSDFRASSAPAGPPGPRRYAEIGPFSFDRTQYAAALAAPVHADAPMREQHKTAALAAGIPPDPAEWLREMTLAFGRDFLTPHQPEPTRRVGIAGLRSLADAGRPVTEALVRDWARERRFTPDAVERYIEWFRQLARSG